MAPLAFSAAWARRSERASVAFMQKPTVKFHTANSQSLAAGVKRDRLSLMLDEKPRVIAGVHTCLASA